MTTVLAMFPGQGSQSPEMSKSLLEQSPKSRTIFEQADEICKMPLTKICIDASEYEKLQLTTYQQPAILTHSYAIWSVIRDETGLHPSFFAGHSLGEYSALVAAEKVSFEKALRLVCHRAKAMQEAVPKGVGGMLAVRSKDFELLSKICMQVREQRGEVLEVVNFNSAEQYILSGHMESIDAVALMLKENRTLSRKLDVSAPFHSSLMKPAREFMQPLIEDTPIKDNDNCIIANVTGAAAKPYEASHLIAKLTSLFSGQKLWPVLKLKRLNVLLNLAHRKFYRV